MKRILITLLIATTLSFIWGALYWMSPLGRIGVKTAENEPALRAALLETLPESGAYFVPDPLSDQSTPEIWVQNHLEGPLAMIHFRKSGSIPMDPMTLLKGYIHLIIVVGIAMMILHCVSDSLKSFRCRFFFVFLLGFLATFNIHIGNIIWFFTPAAFASSQFLFNLINWIIIAICLAFSIKTKTT